MDDPSLSSTCCPSVMLLVGTGTFPPPSAEHGRGGMVSVVMREHPPYMMNGPIEYACRRSVREGKGGLCRVGT